METPILGPDHPRAAGRLEDVVVICRGICRYKMRRRLRRGAHSNKDQLCIQWVDIITS